MSGNGQPFGRQAPTIGAMDSPRQIDDDACYRAMSARDARFDGRFFTGVTSTGIYCRPICRVRLPRRENCRFFEHAAQAEQAGFRPCLRCRPELAPLDRHWSLEDAGAILARHATHWLDNPDNWHNAETGATTMVRLANHLGVSDRHLRRVFEKCMGVSPLQYLQTRKMLTAKQMLADTELPMTTVAFASGFASLRRFNAAFSEHYGFSPSQMRRRPVAGGLLGATRNAAVHLAWRPPYDVPAMLGFLAARQLPGVEHVPLDDRLCLQRTVELTSNGQNHRGWLSVRFEPDNNRLALQVSDGLIPVLPAVIWRVRALFDLDADPQAINLAVGGDFPESEGWRVPGCFDGFELAVRAILGQQVTVTAGRTLTTRLVQRLGAAIDTPIAGLDRLFPSAQVLADAPSSLLGELGIVRQRQHALKALARAVQDGTLVLDALGDVPSTMLKLQALPGVGPWTTQYVAMRALRWPDAWPASDVALLKALHIEGRDRTSTAQAERLSQKWRPWRSYAVIRAWAGLGSKPTPPTGGHPT